MKHSNPALLYFSFDEDRRNLFWKTIHDNGLNHQDIALFKCLEEKFAWTHIADLVLFLNYYKGDYQSLHIIVDILPPGSDKSRTIQIDSLRDAIVSYPEVHFLFDRHQDKELDLLKFLFFDEDKIKEEYPNFPNTFWGSVKEKVYPSYLEVCWDAVTDPEALKAVFYRIICGRDNTFDASNLRYAIKYWKYVLLRVDHNRNFSLIQDSRSESLAICVEEETNQNMLVSYALYKNGYRVFPVTSATELKTINRDIETLNSSSIKNVVVLRDYDLQFEDEGKAVDLIRGYKHCTQSEIDEYYKKIGDEERTTRYFRPGWTDLLEKDPVDDKDNFYWNHLKGRKTFFITKGPQFSEVVPPLGDIQTHISNNNTKLLIAGFQKPISGLYYPFHKIRVIENRFTSTRQKSAFATARNMHDHSTPLDIYDMVNSMLKRAEQYYQERKYRLAALVSSESIELMNGFHQRLMVKAHYINARAENAIAMDVVGGDEATLAADSLLRIEMIRDDINRIFLHEDSDETRKCKHNQPKSVNKPVSDVRSINVLNRIYNDCRHFCKNHEHFRAENRFLNAIGHLNEGYSLRAFWKGIIGFIPSTIEFVKNTFKEMTSYINDVSK